MVITTGRAALALYAVKPDAATAKAIKKANDNSPDCIAINGEGKEIRIEFELLASHFRAHQHDPHGCDLIVCWHNDWAECPVPVLSLRNVVVERAPWAVRDLMDSGIHEGQWTLFEFIEHASSQYGRHDAVELAYRLIEVVKLYPGVFRAEMGTGDKIPTLGVCLLRGGTRRVYTLQAGGKLYVDFTRIKAGTVRSELRNRLAILNPHVMTKSWPVFPISTSGDREVLIESLKWLGHTLLRSSI